MRGALSWMVDVHDYSTGQVSFVEVEVLLVGLRKCNLSRKRLAYCNGFYVQGMFQQVNIFDEVASLWFLVENVADNNKNFCTALLHMLKFNLFGARYK